jgi:hypothetical protein
MDRLIACCIRLVPSLAQCWYAIPMRLMVGFGFIQHGYAKLARGPESFANILDALGVFEPPLLAWATILIERLMLMPRSTGSRGPGECRVPASTRSLACEVKKHTSLVTVSPAGITRRSFAPNRLTWSWLPASPGTTGGALLSAFPHPEFAWRTCRVLAIATSGPLPGIEALPTIRPAPSGRRGNPAQPASPRPSGRWKDWNSNSSPERVPPRQRGRRSNQRRSIVRSA